MAPSDLERTALRAAAERVEALPTEATGADVRKALWLVPSAGNERSGYQKKLRTHQRRVEKAAAQATRAEADEPGGDDADEGGGGAAAPPPPRRAGRPKTAKKAASSDVESLESALGPRHFALHEAEGQLMDKFEEVQGERVGELTEALGTLTISCVTTKLLQPEASVGINLQSVVGELTQAVRHQYTRDGLMGRYRELVREHAAQEEYEREQAERLREVHGAGSGGGGGAAAAGAENAEAEEAEARADNAARRRYYVSKYMNEKVSKLNMRGAVRTARHQLQNKGWEVEPQWDSSESMQIGAYLLKALSTHATFEPQSDDIARARQVYAKMMHEARRTVGVPATDPRHPISQQLGGAMEPLGGIVSDLSSGEEWAGEREQEGDDDDGGEWAADGEEGAGASIFQPSHKQQMDAAAAIGEEGAFVGGSGALDDNAENGVTSSHEYGSLAADLPAELPLDDAYFASDDETTLWDPITGRAYDESGAGGDHHADEGRTPAFQIYTLLERTHAAIAGEPRAWAKPGSKAATHKRVYIRAHAQLYDTLVAGDLSTLRTRVAPDARPMFAPPLAWAKPMEGTLPMGGEYHIDTTLVRTHSRRHLALLAEMPTSNYQKVLDGLDALSATAWRVNERVLRVVEYLWEAYPSGLPHVADSPASVLTPQPPDTAGLDAAETEKANRAYMEEVKYAVRRRANLYSQRATARLKLDVAHDYARETFYFPHNLDFRGRTYAVGPHLQYLGDDLARGLLLFDEAKPLGRDGLYWLKVQLANLFGQDKLSLDGRVAWSDEQIDAGQVRAVNETPVADETLAWWTSSENPVQTLALCLELDAAIASGDAANFKSRCPVHADGSCNGLQHYAALGRDFSGANQVNLVPGEKPADIYSGVRAVVERKVHEHATAPLPSLQEYTAAQQQQQLQQGSATGGAAEYGGMGGMGGMGGAVSDGLILADDDEDDYHGGGGGSKRGGGGGKGGRRRKDGRKSAQEVDKEYHALAERKRLAELLDMKISRKIVKQTVMTTVYGVTNRGAQQQILNRLEEVHAADGFNAPVERKDLSRMATYLARLTLESLDENFQGATRSMKWLQQVAKLISKESNMPVEWTTPLGWPVVQPYFRVKSRRVRTVLHDMTVIDDDDDLAYMENNASAPVKTFKQTQALPPNYVHSLDSSHMLRTARTCRESGMTFAAVHDSYWTHACHMGAMNEILRDEFVALHKDTSLERLYDQMKGHYCCKLGLGDKCPGYEEGGNGPCSHAEGCLRVRWERLEDDPPEPGDLDINVVRDSTYFFS